MTRRSCAAAVVVLAAVAAPPAVAGGWLSKTAARKVAVDTASRTCRSLAWCDDVEVVPPRRCRRAEDGTVFCRIAFVTADRRRCGGVVAVSRTTRGRIQRGMAVPSDCSAAGREPVTA
jgi:hypothetical protein